MRNHLKDLRFLLGERGSRWLTFSNSMSAFLLILATLFVFGEFLNPNTQKVLSKGTEDLATQIAWWRQFGFDELKKGHLALWDPHLFCGAPFFGELQPALLYPPNWLFMALPLPFAVNFFIALHVFSAGWFTYLWIRLRGFHPVSALMSGFMFMFGASLFLRIVPGHLLNIGAMPWIPLLLLAIDGFRKEGRREWIFLGIFVVGLQILSAQFQLCYYTALFSTAYVFATSEKKGRIPLLGGFLAMWSGGALLGAVQVLAGWDALGESLRSTGMSIDTADMASMLPERLWCLLVPGFFGGWRDFWAPCFYWEGCVFVSLTAFVLAVFGFLTSKAPHKAFFLWGGVFLAALAMGLRTPLFAFFFRHIPLFNRFRGVGKVDIYITLCLAALAAMGMEEALQSPGKLKWLAKGTGLACGITALVLAVFKGIELARGRLYVKFGSHAASMELSLLIAFLLLGGLTLLSWLIQKKPAFRYGFLGLAFLELACFARANRPWFDFQELLKKVSPVREIYQKDPGDYRVMADSGNYCLGTGGWDVWGYDTNIPLRYARFQARTQRLKEAENFSGEFKLQEFPDIFGLIRLRYVFKEMGGRLVAQKMNFPEFPRAFCINKWEILNQDEILRRVTEPGFRPAREALLESAPGIQETGGKTESRIELTDISSDEIRVDAHLSKPALLVMTDNYSRGWKAIALGPSTQSNYTLMPVYGFLQAIPLLGGEHHILLEYRPTAYVVGKWISIVSWIFFFGLFALKKRSL
jgi:hypothetical protein